MTALTPLLAPDAPYVPDPTHQRVDARSNMFVMAVLYGDGNSTPVRIRNMSRGGALIESDFIPSEGLPVRLSRGSLSVRGHIAWRRENRAGIRFDAAIEVSAWLPRGARLTHQQRVDEMLAACRTEGTAGSEEQAPAAASAVETIRQLREFGDALRSAGEELSGCMAIASSFPAALQTIDITAQMLDGLASRLSGPR